jgi:hypothetical protein
VWKPHLWIAAALSVLSVDACRSQENFDFVTSVSNLAAFKGAVGMEISPNEINAARFWEQRSKQINGLALPVFGDVVCLGQFNAAIVGLQGGTLPATDFNAKFVGWLLDQGYVHRNQYVMRKMYNGQEVQPETRTCAVLDEKLKEFTTIAPTDSIDRYGRVGIILGNRIFGSVVSTNSFQITAPMQFTVYRAVFSYSINTTLPMINFDGTGSGEIQVFKNPETTQWTLKTFLLRDPPPKMTE